MFPCLFLAIPVFSAHVSERIKNTAIAEKREEDPETLGKVNKCPKQSCKSLRSLANDCFEAPETLLARCERVLHFSGAILNST